MTELKREAIELIENIPDENSDLLAQVVKNLRELIDDAKRQRKQISRVEQNLAVMEEIEALVGEGADGRDGTQIRSIDFNCENSRRENGSAR